MQCDEARRELDEALTRADWSAPLKDHLATCAGCRGYADRLARLEAILRAAGQAAPTVDEEALVAAVVARPSRPGRLLRQHRWWPAAAAVLLVAGGIIWLAPGPEPPVPAPEVPSRIIVTLAETASAPSWTTPAGLSGITGFVVGRAAMAANGEIAELARLPEVF